MSIDTTALTTLPLAAQTRAMAVDSEQAAALLPTFKAMWPDEYNKYPAAMQALAKATIAYGLDPLMGELIVLGGKLYATYEGRLRKALEHAEYAGLECRPATDQERAAFRAAETDHLWRAEIYRRDWAKPIVGWGRVTQNDSNPIARQHPQNQAEKRAKARALRDAFSIPLPNAEDASDYEPAPQRYIDAATGEITDTRPGGMLATRGQIAAIHALCKGLDITDEQRRDAIGRMFGKGATNELTEGEAAAFLEHLGHVQDEREGNRPEIIDAKRRETAPPAPEAEIPRGHESVAGWPPARVEVEAIEGEIVDEPEPEVVAAQPPTFADRFMAHVAELIALDQPELPPTKFQPRASAARDALLSVDGADTDTLRVALERLTGKETISHISTAQLITLEKAIKAGHAADIIRLGAE